MGSKSSKGPSPQESLQKLDGTLELLEKRERKIQKDIGEEEQKAKDNLKAGNKPAAAACLKRKKALVAQLDNLDAQKSNIETMKHKIEEAILNVEVIEAQKLGKDALTKIYGGLSPEEIDNQIQQIQETVANANEISAALSQPIGDGVDEAELEDEMAALEDEIKNEGKKVKTSAATTPAKKDKAAVNADGLTQEDEDALRELENEGKDSAIDADEQLKQLEAELA